MKCFVMLGALLALGLARTDACAQSAAGTAASAPANASSSASRPALAAPDQDFMAKAAGDDALQIAMARLALQQSQNPQVRALSERIMRDHTRMNAELVKISERRHAERASPPVMVKEIEQMQAHLGRLHGTAFEQAFAGMMVDDHRRAIAMFEHEMQDGRDQAVRDFARKEVGTLREHLELANKLLSGS